MFKYLKIPIIHSLFNLCYCFCVFYIIMIDIPLDHNMVTTTWYPLYRDCMESIVEKTRTYFLKGNIKWWSNPTKHFASWKFSHLDLLPIEKQRLSKSWNYVKPWHFTSLTVASPSFPRSTSLTIWQVHISSVNCDILWLPTPSILLIPFNFAKCQPPWFIIEEVLHES